MSKTCTFKIRDVNIADEQGTTQTYTGHMIAQAIDIILNRLQGTTVSKVQISFRELALKASDDQRGDSMPGKLFNLVQHTSNTLLVNKHTMYEPVQYSMMIKTMMCTGC